MYSFVLIFINSKGTVYVFMIISKEKVRVVDFECLSV